jgi:serine/threonine protein kinase
MEMGSLKDLLHTMKIAPAHLVTIARDIARGLQHLHREKVGVFMATN